VCSAAFPGSATSWLPHIYKHSLRHWWLCNLLLCFPSWKTRHKFAAPLTSQLVTCFSSRNKPNSAVRNGELSDKLKTEKLSCRIHSVLVMLQPLRWCCVDFVIRNERDVREEQKYMYVARTSINRVIPMEWSWWVTSNNACEPGEQLIVLANGDDESDLVGWSLLLLAATVRSFAHMPLGISDRKSTYSLFVVEEWSANCVLRPSCGTFHWASSSPSALFIGPRNTLLWAAWYIEATVLRLTATTVAHCLFNVSKAFLLW